MANGYRNNRRLEETAIRHADTSTKGKALVQLPSPEDHDQYAGWAYGQSQDHPVQSIPSLSSVTMKEASEWRRAK